MATKETRKQAKWGGQKTKEQGKKTQMEGKKKENKKKGFHQMVTKFVCTNWICLAPLNGDPSVATKFNYHHWMANKIDSVFTIKFDCCHWMETKKGRIW